MILRGYPLIILVSEGERVVKHILDFDDKGGGIAYFLHWLTRVGDETNLLFYNASKSRTENQNLKLYI